MNRRTLSSLIVSDAPYSEIEEWISRSPSSVNEGFPYVYVPGYEYCGRRLTPLHHAVAKTRWDVVGLLVEKGANINARRGFTHGQTPLHLTLSTHDNAFLTMPGRILSLLRSDYNVNVVDDYNNTPLSYLLNNVYRVCMMKEELEQSRVDSGQDVVVGTRKHLLWEERRVKHLVWVDRYIPAEIVKAFATEKNIMMLPHDFVSRMHGRGWQCQCRQVRGRRHRARWDLLLHFVRLGVKIEKILTSLSEEQAQTAPAFVRELLVSMRQRGKVAKWEYMPYVYVETNRQPLSLHLSAALALKKRVGHMPWPGEHCTLKTLLGVPDRMVRYVENLEQEVEEECNEAPVIQTHRLEDLSW